MRALPAAQPDPLILEPLSPDAAEIKNKHLVSDVCVALPQTAPTPVALLPPTAPLSGPAPGMPRHGSRLAQLGATTTSAPRRTIPRSRSCCNHRPSCCQASCGVFHGDSDKVSGFP